jgi:hypothetical protein
MQRTTVITVVVTAALFAVVGWFAGTKSGQVITRNHPPHDHKSKNCRGNDCDITIKFSCDSGSTPGPRTCDPYADPEVVVVDTGHKIKFTIENPTNANFVFGTDGIKFTSTNSGTYLPCRPQANNTKYECDNTIPSGTPPDGYKYQIHMKDFAIVDPWVVNY